MKEKHTITAETGTRVQESADFKLTQTGPEIRNSKGRMRIDGLLNHAKILERKTMNWLLRYLRFWSIMGAH